MMSEAVGQVIVVAGPTAVGKSSVADGVAQALRGAVVSSDSMQVYRGMDIGTAKMPPAERRSNLLLVDIADPSEPYSAALYQRDARAAIDDLLAAGSVPVVCGGTGLYIDAALDDMHFPSGDLESSSRSKYQVLARELGEKGLHDLLRDRDPKSADAIHPHNVRRVVRALEMLDEGVSYAEQRKGFSSPVPFYSSLRFVLNMDRAALYERINLRVDKMFEDGLVDEVKNLVCLGAREALTSRQAIGYKEVIDYLDGEATLEDSKELIKQRSRRYAKRQLSWFKRDPRFRWIDMDQLGVEGAIEVITDAYRSAR